MIDVKKNSGENDDEGAQGAGLDIFVWNGIASVNLCG